jgi:hypothetical protein
MAQEMEARTIQPLISGGKTILPLRYVMAIRIPPVWNDGDGEQLLSLVAKNGRKLISRRFEDVSEVECKSGWMFLFNQRRLRESLIMDTENSETLPCF